MITLICHVRHDVDVGCSALYGKIVKNGLSFLKEEEICLGSV